MMSRIERDLRGNTTDKSFNGEFAWDLMEVFWWESVKKEASIKDADIVEDNEPTNNQSFDNDDAWLIDLGEPGSDDVQLDSHISGDQELIDNSFSDDVPYDSHVSGDSELIQRQHNKAPYDAHFWG